MRPRPTSTSTILRRRLCPSASIPEGAKYDVAARVWTSVVAECPASGSACELVPGSMPRRATANTKPTKITSRPRSTSIRRPQRYGERDRPHRSRRPADGESVAIHGLSPWRSGLIRFGHLRRRPTTVGRPDVRPAVEIDVNRSFDRDPSGRARHSARRQRRTRPSIHPRPATIQQRSRRRQVRAVRPPGRTSRHVGCERWWRRTGRRRRDRPREGVEARWSPLRRRRATRAAS